jgi:hypothetical protein
MRPGRRERGREGGREEGREDQEMRERGNGAQ